MAWRESPAPKESEISPRGNPLRESVRGAFGIRERYPKIAVMPEGAPNG
jgi:hypothetical protein